MAITPAACQAALNAVSPTAAEILRANEVAGMDATKQEWYVDGGVDAPGRCRWVVTTASDNAATQAAAILAWLTTNSSPSYNGGWVQGR
jgi:hypothetical protein